jgi:hypothetical protein
LIGKAKLTRWQLSATREPNHSGANPQIVLAVVETVGESRHEILSLHGPGEDVPGNLEIDPAVRRHREIIFRDRFANPIGCANPSEESPRERRHSAVQFKPGRFLLCFRHRHGSIRLNPILMRTPNRTRS